MTREEFVALIPKTVGGSVVDLHIKENKLTTAVAIYLDNILVYTEGFVTVLGYQVVAEHIIRELILMRYELLFAAIMKNSDGGPVMAEGHPRLWEPTKIPEKLAERPMTPDDAIESPKKLIPRQVMDEIVRPTKPGKVDYEAELERLEEERQVKKQADPLVSQELLDEMAKKQPSDKGSANSLIEYLTKQQSITGNGNRPI